MPGLHYLYLALNKTSSAEPRASLQYKINPNHTISFATGIYGKTLPLGSYFYKATRQFISQPGPGHNAFRPFHCSV